MIIPCSAVVLDIICRCALYSKKSFYRQELDALFPFSSTLGKQIDSLHFMQPQMVIAGSTLIWIVDRFALNNYNLSHPITNLSENIGMPWYQCMSMCAVLCVHIPYM